LEEMAVTARPVEVAVAVAVHESRTPHTRAARAEGAVVMVVVVVSEAPEEHPAALLSGCSQSTLLA
tara:strand:- start:89 stop:286 length:198 start_codon:yes stop_codon:yes gene_type:complete